MQVAYISIMHCSLPVISLLTCCQKEVQKAYICLHSQAARHSGILHQNVIYVFSVGRGVSLNWALRYPSNSPSKWIVLQPSPQQRQAFSVDFTQTFIFFI